jgi:hypothetical protein
VEDVDDEDEPANQEQNNVNDNVPVDPLQESAVSAEEKQQLQVVRQKIMEIKMEHCVYCKEKWFDIKLKDGKCSKCQKNQKFQAVNKMDPGIIPQALPQLTQIEEIIIAPIHALVQLWQVQGGQYKYTGHICNFPRENAIMVAKVPLLPEECDIIIMRRSGTENVTNEQIFRDFQVRQGVVQQWLQYLEQNHPAFHNQGGSVRVDYTLLNQLPEDDSVHSRICTIEVEAEENLAPDNVGPQQDNEINNGEANQNNNPIYSAGFVPNVNMGTTEMQQLQAAATNDVDNPIILTMPHIRGTPINENMSIPIAINAFPSLFPTGKADFSEVCEEAVTMNEWAAHLLCLEDGRFAHHPRFCYWVLNSIMRKSAKKASNWYLTTHRDDRQLTVEDIRAMINAGDGQNLAQCISHAGEKLPGSKPFWKKTQQELIAQIRSPTCQSPHIFFTASSADIQWPDMHQHMPNHNPNQQEDATSYCIRMKDLNENPAIAGYYFQKRWEIFFEHYLKPIFKVKDYW